MLSSTEKVLFIIIAIAAIGASFITFRKMFRAIGKGTQPINWKAVWSNYSKGLELFISQITLFKSRPVIGLVHAFVAWGFTLYLLVNVVDVLYGFIPGFHFFPDHFIGKAYRVFVDAFTVMVLIGVMYFLLRRFVLKDSRLNINEPVMLSPEAKKGMRMDSLIVGFFILFHVGARFLSASFEIAKNNADSFQPAATMVSLLWSNFSEDSIIFMSM